MLLLARLAGAVEVWMPETGDVVLEASPTGQEGERFRRAVALVGAGQWAGGIDDLRRLIAENPTAPWVPQARSVLARGLIASGAYREGFEELETLRNEAPDTPLGRQARELQVTAARQLALKDPPAARQLFQRLMARAQTADEAAEYQKEQADAFFQARHYLEAEDEYLQLATRYRDSIWAPYAWYRIADCERALAEWLDLGLERLQLAEKAYQDYLSVYPDGANAPEAKAKIAEVRELAAAKHREVAEFYINAEKRPWAAVPYLNHIVNQFAESPHADWARAQLERIAGLPGPPLRGRLRQFDVRGVSRTATAE